MVRRIFPLGSAALVAYAAALLIVCVGTWQVWLARDAAIRDTQQDTRNLSGSLGQHAARSVETVDLVLTGVVARIEGGALSDPAKLKRILDWRRGMVPQILNLMVLDANGDWVADSMQTPHAPINTADRPYFAWHRDHPEQDLHIDAPVKSRFSGATVIPLTRRWNHPDGSFGGVVFAALRPEHFQRFYDSLGLGSKGLVTLLSLSGRMLARHPSVADLIGRDLSNTPLFRDKLRAEPAGSYIIVSPVDGVERIVAYERVEGYPLVVYVGRGLAEVLAPWRRDALVEGAILTLAAAGLVGLGIGLGRHQRRAALAEAAVIASEARYRQLTETTNDVITRLDLTFQRTYVSPTCRTLFGYTPEEMLGRQPSAAIHPDDAPAVRDLARRLVAGEIPDDKATTSYRTRHKLGRTIWIESGLSLVRDAAGAPEAVVCTLRDVTERKRAEEALAVSEAQYRLLSEHATDMVTQMDLTGVHLYVSPGCRDLLGYEPHELVGTRPQQAIHPDDAPSLAAFLDRLADGTCDRGTHINRLRHRDGRWIWVEASLKRLADADGRCTGFVAALRNVTERRQADEALRESEARHRLLAETTSDVIARIDLNGTLRYLSPAAESVTGYRLDELVGRVITDFVHPDDVDGMRQRFRALVAAGPGARDKFEYRIVRRDGCAVWLEVNPTVLFDAASGMPSGFIDVARDVTSRKVIEAELEVARHAAEAGARAKAEFLANMSHELRTPLTGMLGVHDLLHSDPSLTDRQRHFVDLAQDSGRALLTIVNDILDFSKIEADQMAIEQVPFRLRDLVESCRQLGTEAIKLKGVSLTKSVEADVPDLFLGDPTRLRQVLLNLTTNAIKFTTHGHIDVQVRWSTNRLRFSVSDTGIGIPPAALPHLFERFNQADGSTARRFGGTGLGLAICKRLVELMGGIIGVESTPGLGSTFWFEVPLLVGEHERPVERRRNALADATGVGRRILVAEDNSINQEIIQCVLDQRGHLVTMVADGTAAVEAFRQGVFDVILMDVQMPGTDGLAATREIRRLERSEVRAATPIVALTANAMAEEAQLCREAGMDGHIAKPIDWAQLFSTLDDLCRSHGPATEIEPSVPPWIEPGRIPAVLDENALADLAELLGRDRIGDMLAAFRHETDRRLGLMEAPDAEMAAHAHALVSLAGQLGFVELSALCVEVERRVLDGEVVGMNPDLRAAAERAITAAACSTYAKAA